MIWFNPGFSGRNAKMLKSFTLQGINKGKYNLHVIIFYWKSYIKYTCSPHNKDKVQ